VTLALGIDPGSRITGYGLVASEGSRLTFLAADCIKTNAKAPLAQRLGQVYNGLVEVIRSHTPEVVAVEDIFYAKNVRSAAVLGHVRGVALLAAAISGLEVFEYAPAQTKVAVAGYGRADKAQVALMVKQILGIRGNLQPDASDALAVAICHLNQTPALRGTK
jgi:crossover junction endodeoxyribonuclease RuvC